MPGRQQDRRPDPARPDDQVSSGFGTGRPGVSASEPIRGDLGAASPSGRPAARRTAIAGSARVRLMSSSVPPASWPSWTPSAGLTRVEAVRAGRPHRRSRLDRRAEAAEQDRVAVDAEDRADIHRLGGEDRRPCRPRARPRCRRPGASRRPTSAVQTMRPSAVAAGTPGHDVDPGRVGVGADHGGRPRCRVDREDAHVPLVTAGHDEEWLAGAAPSQRGSDQVRAAPPSPSGPRVRPPVRAATKTETTAFGVPAAG